MGEEKWTKNMEKYPQNERTKSVSISFTEWQREFLDHIVEKGFYTNRSEFIRSLLMQYYREVSKNPSLLKTNQEIIEEWFTKAIRRAT